MCIRDRFYDDGIALMSKNKEKLQNAVTRFVSNIRGKGQKQTMVILKRGHEFYREFSDLVREFYHLLSDG